MAINKKQASPVVKIGIIVVAVLLVLAFALPLVSPNLLGGGDTTSTGSGQLETIASNYSGTIAAYQQQLASDPTSYTVLVSLGNTYSDWASAIFEYQGAAGGADQPVWVAAATYYASALEVQPGDPNVMTDMAIADYYSGNLDMAITTIEQVMADNSDFAPAYLNGAIFYRTASRAEDAIAAAQKFLELDPTGQFGNPETAQGIISELSSSATP